jgi:hypothetical protein
MMWRYVPASPTYTHLCDDLGKATKFITSQLETQGNNHESRICVWEGNIGLVPQLEALEESGVTSSTFHFNPKPMYMQ